MRNVPAANPPAHLAPRPGASDDTDSRVDILATVLADLGGIVRLGTGLARGTIKVPELRHASRWVPGAGSGALARQAARFLVIGVASTIAYVLLYLLLRTVMAAQPANAISLLVTAVANTAANRRITFAIRGRSHAARHQFRGLIAFGAGLALTSGALAALHAISPSPGRLAELAVLVAASLVATVLRFVLYRSWVFGIRRGARGSLGTAADAGRIQGANGYGKADGRSMGDDRAFFPLGGPGHRLR